MSCPAPAPPQPSRGPGELGRLRPCPAPVPQEEPGTACLPEEGHPQLQGWDGSWIWVQLVTFLGCSFSFPARSAQRWRRWQLHGSAVPVAAVRPRPDAGEAAAAPPARGQRLLPGTEAPLRALPGVSWQRLTPHTALTAPAHSGTGAGRVIALAALVPVAPWGARGGPVAVPACPFPLQPKRPRCHQCSCASSCPVSPRGPSRALGVQLELGGQRGPLHPRAVLQGKPCFPSKGCNPGPTGLAGGQGPWLSLGWWLGATKAARAAVPGQSSNSSPDRTCGSCEPPLAPVPLQGWADAGLAVDGLGLGGPTLLCAAPGAALLLGRGWSSSTIVSSLSLAPFT